MRFNIALAVILLGPMFCSGQKSNDRIFIGAASDLKFALDSAIARFELIHPEVTVHVSYGSSGKLFEQISNGAPFDMFFSADIDYPRKLKDKGLCESELVTYGYGRIVLWSKKFDVSKPEMSLLLQKEVKKIAIANPLHAPYGKRAVDALRFYSLYDKVSGRLVYGENISQAAQFASSGAADAGIIALSLALSPNMKKTGGNYYVIPLESHSPLEQAFVVLSRAKEKHAVNELTAFMKSEASRKILAYFGFVNHHP